MLGNAVITSVVCLQVGLLVQRASYQ